jgi:hypothetical protein
LEILRIRGLRILLFPIAVPLTLLGWALYVVGDKQAYSKLETKRKTKERDPNKKSITNEEQVEMGLIDKILEEQMAS